jgi:hypothetical protein
MDKSGINKLNDFVSYMCVDAGKLLSGKFYREITGYEFKGYLFCLYDLGFINITEWLRLSDKINRFINQQQ